jgi:hypothetical protein
MKKTAGIGVWQKTKFYDSRSQYCLVGSVPFLSLVCIALLQRGVGDGHYCFVPGCGVAVWS